MKPFNPLQQRIVLGWSLINFFLMLSGKEWDELPFDQRMDVHRFIASLYQEETCAI